MAAAAQIAVIPGTQWTPQPAQSWWSQTSRHDRISGLDADASLVERCLSGQEAAWEDLVKTHTRRVYAICYRFTGADSEAQDLTQEVFLRIFKSLKSFRAGEGSFIVWLTR